MSIHDDHLQISTPENVAFSFPVAGIGSRFIAALVDTAAILFIQGAVLIFGSLLAGTFLNLDAAFSEHLGAWIIGIFGLVSFIFLWGYYIFFEMLWQGQTPGKRLARLRVVRVDGGPISFSESVIRNLVRLVDFLPMIYGLGVVVMFIDGKARRLGDLVAGTLVVREPQSRYKPAAYEHEMAAPGPIAGFDQLPLERLGRDDLALIETYLKRRDELSDTAVLGQQIVTRLFRRFDLPEPSLDRLETVRLFQAILAETGNGNRPG